MSTEIAERLRPYEHQIQRLSTIPGMKRRLAEVILAEIGPDMSRFRKSPDIWLRGLVCALASMRVEANASQARRAKVARGFVPLWWRQLMLPSMQRTLTSRLSTSGLLFDGEARKLPSQSAILCW